MEEKSNIFDLQRDLTQRSNSDRGVGTPLVPRHAVIKDLKELYATIGDDVLDMAGSDLEKQIKSVSRLLLHVVDFSVRMGWNIEEICKLIVQTDLAKTFPDGKFRHEEDGTLKKPHGWHSPPINEVIHIHLSEGSWPEEDIDIKG